MSAVQETTQKLNWELLGYFLYCWDLCDMLEVHLDDKCFSGDAEVEHDIWLWP
jgi:hypothetical protein